MFGYYFTIGSGEMTQIITYAKNVISDFLPILVLFIGIAVAGAIVDWFMKRRGD